MPRPPGCCSSHGVEYLQSADRLKPQSPSGEYEHREFRWFTRQNYWIHQYVCRSNELFCVWYAIGIKMAWYRYRHPKNLNFYSKQMINPRNSGTCSCQLILQVEIVWDGNLKLSHLFTPASLDEFFEFFMRICLPRYLVSSVNHLWDSFSPDSPWPQQGAVVSYHLGCL